MGRLGGGLGGFWLPGATWEASRAARGRFWWPRWPQLGSQDGFKLGPRSHIDANIARIFDAFENRNLDGKSCFLIEKGCFLDLIWDEILIIRTFRS